MHRFAFIIICLTSSLAWAEEEKDGPFGIYMGMPIEQLDVEDCMGTILCTSDFHSLASVPKPLTAFPTYLATASAKAGVCEISAISELVPTAEYEGLYRTIVTDMKLRYGRRYSIPKVRKDKHATAKLYHWYKEGEDANWPNVETVEMIVTHYSKAAASVTAAPVAGRSEFVLKFRFSNESECRFVDLSDY